MMHGLEPDWRSVVLRSPQEPSLFHLLDGELRSMSQLGVGGSQPRSKKRWCLEQDEMLRAFAERAPGAVAAKYPFDSIVRLGNVRPIFAAVAVGASAEAVAKLCDACPAALADKSACGWTPLHAACSYGADYCVIQVLVDRCPEALAVRDIKKQTPLHAACESQASPEVVSYLVRRRPEALTETSCSSGIYGQTPLHIACGFAAPYESIRLLLLSYPWAARRVDDDGRLPLHLAVCHNLFRAQNLSSVYNKTSPKTSLDVVRLLLEEHPAAVKAGSGRKWGTPLSLAMNKTFNDSVFILNSVIVVNELMDTPPTHGDFRVVLDDFRLVGWENGISIAFEVHPNLLDEAGIDLKLMPHLLCKLGKGRKIRTSYRIMQEHIPSLLAGRYPDVNCHSP